MTAPSASGDSDSPWRFLGALTDSPRDQQLLEQTRGRELDTVESMITASRASILYASSGNGKTSLLRAGVVPRFRARGFTVFTTRPRPPEGAASPLVAFKEVILGEMSARPSLDHDTRALLRRAALALQATASTDQHPGNEALRQELARRAGAADQDAAGAHAPPRLELGLAEFMGAVRREYDTDRILVICDQFEELFVHYANRPELTEFARELGGLWRSEEAKTHLLFSLREDWVGSMIELREAIPDVFEYFYKLQPLSSSRAELALRMPLGAMGLASSEALTKTVVADLAARYRQVQSHPYGAIRLARSPDDDPYVEAPALQVVADRMWATRFQYDRPFVDPAHYRGIAEGLNGPGESPSDKLLDAYVRQQLDAAECSDALSSAQWLELRQECLYAMTDGSAHRRALAETALLREVGRLRLGVQDAHQISVEQIREAIGPLIQSRLVRRVGEEPALHYELAHDFAVRSVLADFRALERRRFEEAALQRERNQLAHRTADRTHSLGLQLPRVASFAMIGGTVAAALTALPAAALLFLLGTLLLGAYSALGSIARTRGMSWLGGLAASGALVIAMIYADVPPLSGVVIVPIEKRLAHPYEPSPLTPASVLRSIEGGGYDPYRPNGHSYWSSPGWRVYGRNFAVTLESGMLVGLVLLAAAATIAVRRDALVSGSRFRALRLVCADAVDSVISIGGGPGAIGTILFASDSAFGSYEEVYTVSVIFGAFSAGIFAAIWTIVARARRTPGVAASATRLQTFDGKRPGLGRLFVRQLLHGCWAAFNLAALWLPWFVWSVLQLRSRADDQQLWYDWILRLKLVDETLASTPVKAAG